MSCEDPGRGQPLGHVALAASCMDSSNSEIDPECLSFAGPSRSRTLSIEVPPPETKSNVDVVRLKWCG